MFPFEAGFLVKGSSVDINGLVNNTVAQVIGFRGQMDTAHNGAFRGVQVRYVIGTDGSTNVGKNTFFHWINPINIDKDVHTDEQGKWLTITVTQMSEQAVFVQIVGEDDSAKEIYDAMTVELSNVLPRV